MLTNQKITTLKKLQPVRVIVRVMKNVLTCKITKIKKTIYLQHVIINYYTALPFTGMLEKK